MLSRPAPVRLLAVAVTGLAVLGGCGIAAEQTARQIPDPPADLVDGPTSTTEPQRPRFTLTLFFVNPNNQLVDVDREFDDPPTPATALAALSPTSDELARAESNDTTRGMSSKLGGFLYEPQPVQDGVLNITVTGVEGESFRETIESSRVTLIYQQIVCTVSNIANAGIEKVAIIDDQGQIPVLVSGSPTAVSEPVGPDLFNGCRAEATVPPSTTTTTRSATTTRPTVTLRLTTSSPTTDPDQATDGSQPDEGTNG